MSDNAKQVSLKTLMAVVDEDWKKALEDARKTESVNPLAPLTTSLRYRYFLQLINKALERDKAQSSDQTIFKPKG